MIRMSMIWDRTMEVVRGRGALLATIVALLSLLPSLVRNALTDFALSGSLALVPLIGLVGLAVAILGLWSNAAVVAAGVEPSIARAGDAIAISGRRLPLLIGIVILAVIAAIIVFLPAIGILGASMFDLAAMRANPGAPFAGFTVPSPGAIAGFALYILALGVLALWLGARLFLLLPVIVNERLGLGSFARSFQLTRGLTWRIIGVQLLFGLVFFIALFAVQAVFGLVARLLLGPDQLMTAAFVAQTGAGLLTAAYTALIATFTAQLYRAITGTEAARAFA